MEEEQKTEVVPVEEETTEEETPVEEETTEEAAPEETTEEAPVEEEKTEEVPAEGECCCSPEATKSAEDMIRDLVNLINVMKEEEVEGVTTKIQPAAADELVAKLEEVAKAVGEICG